jgi:hypothetical protein
MMDDDRDPLDPDTADAEPGDVDAEEGAPSEGDLPEKEAW